MQFPSLCPEVPVEDRGLPWGLGTQRFLRNDGYAIIIRPRSLPAP